VPSARRGLPSLLLTRGGERLLFPLVFCRECGQEYYMVSWAGGEGGNITPRLPFLTSDEDDAADSRQGYVALNVSEDGPLWTEDHARDLPDFWYEARSERLKKDYRQHVPHLLKVAANGTVGGEDAPEVWFEQRPFLLCLRCGAAFDRTERNEFKKLSRLSNAGRSTATTVVSGSAIVQLREDRQVQPEAQKLMSFTDNRQDASLQAGHFNDFIQVGLLRAGLFKALQERQALEHFPDAHQEHQTPATVGHGIAAFGHAVIAALAYEHWQARGCPHGSPQEDWFQAAEELRSRSYAR